MCKRNAPIVSNRPKTNGFIGSKSEAVAAADLASIDDRVEFRLCTLSFVNLLDRQIFFNDILIGTPLNTANFP